ncbi:DoxX family protein [Eudoraea chungangensis]|uniref:DoxX family protein n=1 Tax=Eudoraea chungangensis TaxID=1481905 RepID=UPI0030B9C11C
MAVLYITAGIMHFIKPRIYLRIIPDYLPYPRLLVSLSGIAEVILGIGLMVPVLKNLSLLTLIIMLLIFLTVHFNMLKNKKASLNLPKWLLLLRIILQFLLIYWAYSYLNI